MAKDYGLSFISNEDLFFHVKETIESTPARKTTLPELKNTGYFHQSLLKSIVENRHCRSNGFDVIHRQKKIFAEIKNTCPSMNSSSARDTYMQMQHEILSDRSTTCYLVEMTSKSNQESIWKITIDGQKLCHENIKRIPIDNFYGQVTGINNAYKALCQILPLVLKDLKKSTQG